MNFLKITALVVMTFAFAASAANQHETSPPVVQGSGEARPVNRDSFDSPPMPAEFTEAEIVSLGLLPSGNKTGPQN